MKTTSRASIEHLQQSFKHNENLIKNKYFSKRLSGSKQHNFLTRFNVQTAVSKHQVSIAHFTYGHHQ